LRETLDAYWSWEQEVIASLSPHVVNLFFYVIFLVLLLDFDAPLFELVCDVVVELKGRPKTSPLFALEFKFHEWSLINFRKKSEGRWNKAVSPDHHLLLRNLLEVVLLAGLDLLSTALLLNVLAKEVNGAMHVNGADERNQLKVELLGCEREQERAVLENLLKIWWDCSLDQVIRILDTFL
jgi:hypothetical protein